MLRRNVLKRCRQALPSIALLAVTLAFIEGALQAAARWGARFDAVRLINAQTRPLVHSEAEWKRRFIEGYQARSAADLPVNRGEFQPDAELGWRPKENVSLIGDDGVRTTTNSLGFRSLREYEPQTGSYTVLVLGDSFTYGSGASDDEVWPTILQKLEPDLDVLNMAAGGYGIDQMYLMLDRHIDTFVPQLVVLAFINDDIHRSALAFRDYQKPRLEVQNGELVVTNVPVGDVHTVARGLMDEGEAGSRWPDVKLANILARMWSMIVAQPAAERRLVELNERILGETIERASEVGAEFLLVYLPAGRSLEEPDFYPTGEQFFDRFVREHGVHALNVRPLLMGVEMSLSGGHYRATGAAIVAESVGAKVDEIRRASVTTGR
jgi:hypothetical protein